jgi:hypothetical protein
VASDLNFRLRSNVPSTLLSKKERKAGEAVTELFDAMLQSIRDAGDDELESVAQTLAQDLRSDETQAKLKADVDLPRKLQDLLAGQARYGSYLEGTELPGVLRTAIEELLAEVGGAAGHFLGLLKKAAEDEQFDAYEKHFFDAYDEDFGSLPESQALLDEYARVKKLGTPQLAAPELNPPSRSPFFQTDALFQGELSLAVEDPEQGTLSFTVDGKSYALPTELSRRGESARADGFSLDKLKLAFDGDDLEGSPLDKLDSLKMSGLPLPDEGEKFTEFGRIGGDVGAHREAFAYRIMELLGVQTLKARPAQLVLVDTETGDRTEHRFMFGEDIDDAAKRLGGVEVEEMLKSERFGPLFSQDLLARTELAEILLGNEDFEFPDEYEEFFEGSDDYPSKNVGHNIRPILRPDGSVVPVAHDFDLASIVTGGPRSSKEQWLGEPPQGDARLGEMILAIASMKSRFPTSTIESIAQSFEAQRAAIEQGAAAYGLDAESQALVLEHVSAFFRALPEAMKLPVTRPNASFFESADAPEALSEFSRLGSPVEILERQGERVKVRMLRASDARDQGEGSLSEVWMNAQDLVE